MAGLVWRADAERRVAGPANAATATKVGDPATNELACETEEHGVLLGQLPEASGLAFSRRTPGVLWSMNDSGKEQVVALDLNGRVLGAVHVTGVQVGNWEDVSVAPCDGGSCLYISDTGDHAGTQRNDIIVYRVPEPKPTDAATAPAETIEAAYPDDEDHEAEAMFVLAGRMYLVTKGHPNRVFRFPNAAGEGLETLEEVGQVPTERFEKTAIKRQTRITDAETSPDGNWVAMRTNKELLVYRAADIIAGHFGAFSALDLSSIDEPQGEGVAITNEGVVFLASEGGGKGLPGTFARLKCQLPGAASELENPFTN
jgi:hypothetical protein